MGAMLDARRRLLASKGRPMVLRRQLTVTTPTWDDVTVQGFARAYRPEDIAGGLQQGDQQIEILDEEIAATAWPTPIRFGDKVTLDGRTVTVQGARQVYEETLLIGHSLWVRG